MSLKGRAIRVSFSGTTILHGVDFVAERGQLIGILGPSGSGKSTLMMALSGFRPADEGKVLFDGQDLYEGFETMRRAIGFVPQDDVVPTALSVETVLRDAAELRLPQASEATREARVEGLIAKLGLAERRGVRVSKLSGGQRKRVSVAVELLARPDLLFADEPTSGLDPALEVSLTRLLKEMADEGRVVVVTTHVMASLLQLDRVCLLQGGQVVYFGPPAGLKEHFAVDDFTAIYTRLGEQSPEHWRTLFERSPMYREHLRGRLEAA